MTSTTKRDIQQLYPFWLQHLVINQMWPVQIWQELSLDVRLNNKITNIQKQKSYGKQPTNRV